MMINNIKNIISRNISVTLIILGGILIIISYFLFEYLSDSAFFDEFSKVALQSAIFVFIGAALNKILSDAKKKNEQEDNDRRNRIEFLRRVRALHGVIQSSQILLIAHKSPKTYVEVLRYLIQLQSDVIEISEDLKVTIDLFNEKEQMVSSIENISSYIKEGIEEYMRYKKIVESKYDKNKDDNLTSAIEEGPMTWLDGFWNSSGTYESIYAPNITTVKKLMREYVYSRNETRV